jgi:hypothetical protein
MGLTILSPSFVDCLEIWELQPPENLWASDRPVRSLIYLFLYNAWRYFYILFVDYISTRKTVAKKLCAYIYDINQLLQYDYLTRGWVLSDEVHSHTIIRTNYVTQLFNTTSISLRRSVFGLSLRGTWFDPRGVHVVSVVNNWQSDRIYSVNFDSPLPVSLHRYSTLFYSSITNAMHSQSVVKIAHLKII